MGAIQLLMERLGYVSLKRYGLERTAGGRIVSHRTAVVDSDLIVGWEDNDLGAMELPRWFAEMAERSEGVDQPPSPPGVDDRAEPATSSSVIVAEDLTAEVVEVEDDDDWKRALAKARGEDPEFGPVRVLRRAASDDDDDASTAAVREPELVEHVEAIDSGDIVATHVEAGAPPVVDNPLVDEWYSAFESRPRADAPVVISLRALPNDESAYEDFVIGVRPLRVVIPKAPRSRASAPVPPRAELPTVEEASAANPRDIRKRPTMPTIPPLPPARNRARLAKGTETDAILDVPPPKLVVVPPLPRVAKSEPEARR